MSNTRSLGPIPPVVDPTDAPIAHDMADRTDQSGAAPSLPIALPPPPCACAGAPTRLGGGRPPRSPGSYVDSRLLMPAQFFSILEDEASLSQFLRARLEFHSAVFPFIDMADMGVH